MKVAIENYEMYNNGILLCKWFDTNESTLEEVTEWCKEVAINSGFNGDDMELFVADYEDDLGLFSGECLINAYEVTERLEGLSDDEVTGVALLMDNGIVSNLDEAIEKKDEIHNTGETDMEDVAIEYIESTGGLDGMSDNLKYYFDYAALGRDMEIEGTYLTESDGTIWEYVA